MNIKFPKEEIVFVEKLRNSIITKEDIKEVVDEVLEHAKFLYQYNPKLLDTYIKTLFELRLFEMVINITEDLKKQNLESMDWYFYSFASLIANKDFLYVKRLIKKSELFSSPSIQYLIDPEEAHYSAILNLHPDLLDTIGPSLILINFTNELIQESLNQDIDDEYMIMRFFDLLNLLYEYSVDEKIIDLFDKTIKSIYEIPLE